MKIRAAFVGINKHLDPKIRELTGARRDATRLWALFSDSIPDLDATLLLDEQATLERIRGALNETLQSADENDVVILAFSGHGTHDHRLVAYNTATNALADTTVPMEELASDFRTSKARAIVCILDCCFSGGAPARVLEESPSSRDPTTPFEEVAGRGRVLITASGVNEPAWELPGTGYGILTKALTDAFEQHEGPVSVPAIMDEVLVRVRAEAERIGVTQTPVLFGYIEGGLSLPMFRKGKHFREAFPESLGMHISGAITELGQFGIPEGIIREWQTNFSEELNSLQVQAVNEHRVLDGESLLVVAPTSSGKTFIGEMAAARAIAQGRKAVFLLPYRALVNEKYEQFASTYGSVGMRVIRCTGDYADQTNPFVRGQYDLGILTYEMFLNLALNNPSTLNHLGLVVLDEAQFITDPNRGINVELLLTLLIAGRERGIVPQLIVL
jgi:helicase